MRPGKFFKRSHFVKFCSLLLLGAGYVIYVLIGGVIFWKLEGDQVMTDIAQLEVKKKRFLQVYPCLGQSGMEELADVSYRIIILSLLLIFYYYY